jgi:hypothetical protein
MKNIKKLVAVASILVLSLGLLVACGKKDSEKSATKENTTTQTSKKKDEIKVSLILMKDDKELAKKEVTLSSQSNLFDAMTKHFKVKDDAGFITEIDGLEQDTKEQLYWTYTINDKMINTGAKDTMLKEGDKVVFKYGKF